jgi:heme exporter protein B
MLKSLWQVFYADFLLLLNNTQEWLSAVGFFVIVMSLFPLAFDPSPIFLQKYVPNCIWLAALLASLLSIENIFLGDLESGHFEQLMLGEAPFTLLMLSKLSAQWLITQLPLVFLTPLLAAIFQFPLPVMIAVSMGLLFGTPALTLIGSLGAALTLGMRLQGALLGLLILPLSVPILIFGVMSIQQAQAGLPMGAPLALLAGLSILAITLLPWAITFALRLSMQD